MNTSFNPDTAAATESMMNDAQASPCCGGNTGCATIGNHFKASADALRSRTAHLTDDAARSIRAAGRNADAALRSHPYQAMGITAGIAFLLGYLASRR